MPRSPANQPGERHQKILWLLETFRQQSGLIPSYRDIGKAIGVKSPSLVKFYLDQLEGWGYIERIPGQSRSIRVIKSNQSAQIYQCSARRIPVIGRIVAGAPIPLPDTDLSMYDEESWVEVTESQVPRLSGEYFALEVQGKSMIDAMIGDGDTVIMRPASQAANGDMVAARIKSSNETTLKYYYQEGSQVRLQPANPFYTPIFVESNDLEVQGLLVTVIRRIRK